MRLTTIHLQENSKLISGHVAEKKGYLYWVLNLTDENGKRKPKWIPTHKKVKGNKTWANNMLPTIRKEWTEKLLQEATASQQSASPSGPSSAAISFVDFLYQWLEYKYKSATGRVMDSKPIELSTYSGYEQQLNNPIAPYFREHPVALCDLTKQDILAFYTCASLLLANGVPMEQVKEWLGHSEISTTVDIYGHLQYATKKQSAAAIEQDIVAPMLQNLSAVSP